MDALGSVLSVPCPVQPPASFGDWRAGVIRGGALPVVAIAGSRGKSLTLDLFDAMLNAHGLRTARWTDGGVVVGGRRQRGELVPWTKALAALAAGTLDVAVQELDWDTVHAVGLPRGAYPLVAVTNLCANSEACLVRPDTLRAVRALRTIRESAHPDAIFVLNGDDWAVAGGEAEHLPRQILTAMSADTPLLRAHRQHGGIAVWIEDGGIRWGPDDGAELLAASSVRLTRQGAVSFMTTNALIAAALALAVGLPAETVVDVLVDHVPDPSALPDSFTLVERDGATLVVDRPALPYFLRAPLRAVGHLPGSRHIRVIGEASAIPDEDLIETGRVLARGASLIVLHDAANNPERGERLRSGIAAHDVPPVVVHAASESAAISVVTRMLRPDDVVYILADDPRTVARRLRRSTAGSPASAG